MRMRAQIKAIEYYLPEKILSNKELAADYPEWPATKIKSKLGIGMRHVAKADECASDLAFKAAQKLFASGVCCADDIDFILLCTQSPDYLLPTTACLLQDRLGIPISVGALDFNLGCSGYIYGLGLAKGLIESDQAKNVLLLMAETYSKYIHPGDRSTRTVFGDAAAATLVSVGDDEKIGPFVFGTDGSGGQHLIVPTGGARQSFVQDAPIIENLKGHKRTVNSLFMSGLKVFTFAVKIVPVVVDDLLKKASLSLDEVDWFVFHQANEYLLEYIRKQIDIPSEKFVISMYNSGNTVSSTIPIALKSLDDIAQDGDRIMLIGFGVGFSWGGSIIKK